MAYPGVVEDVRICCAGGRPGRLPVFALGLEFDMEQGGVTCRENRLDVEKTVMCKAAAVRRCDYDLAEIFPDDYIEFEPLDLTMMDEPDQPAMPAAYLPLCPDSLRRFSLPNPDRDGRMPVHLEMLRQLKRELGDTVCVMGRIAAPFSVLGLLYGIDMTFLAMLDNPDLVRDNMRFFVEHQILFGQAQLEAGADMLWLGDCVADSKLLGPDHYREFAFEPAAEVARALTKLGGIVVYHTCETSLPHLAMQAQLPASMVNVGEGVDLAVVREYVGSGVCLSGNFDPMLLRDGTPEDIAAAAGAMIDRVASAGGYIFNTGEGIMRSTPPANVEAMMRAAKSTAAARGVWPE